MTLTKASLLSVILVPTLTITVPAQTKPADQSPQITQIFTLNTTDNPPYAVEVLMALRNILPKPASALVDESTSSITVKGTGPQIELARKIISDLEAAPAPAVRHSESAPFQTSETKPTDMGVATFAQTFYLGNLSPEDMAKVLNSVHDKRVHDKTSSRSKVRVFPVLSLGALVVHATNTEELDHIKIAIAEVLPDWSADAQSSERHRLPPATIKMLPAIEQAFYLRSGEPRPGASKNTTDAQNFFLENEIASALRNTFFPFTMIYVVHSKHTAILVGTEEDLRLAQELMNDLDKAAMRHPHAARDAQIPAPPMKPSPLAKK